MRQGSEPLALLGHSLGGLVALQALNQRPELPVTHVLCLGTPLRGSDAARGLARHAWAAPALGRSAGLLQAGFDRWEEKAPRGGRQAASDDAPRPPRPSSSADLFADSDDDGGESEGGDDEFDVPSFLK